jgi:hypothetical protein
VYDKGGEVLDPGLCGLPAQCTEAVNQAQGVRQRFTLGEMYAIHSAGLIFRTAQSNIGIASLNGAVTIEKRYQIADSGDLTLQTALGQTVGHTITLSARWWGEGKGEFTFAGQAEATKSIDSYGDVKDPLQYRTWIVLHEMGHVLLGELGFDEQTLYGQLQTTTSFLSLGLYPTRYAYTLGGEYVVEAVTGTLWNSGYVVVAGFDSSAGGRTGLLGADNPPSFAAKANGKNYAAYVRNVADANWGSPTLAEWSTNNILT